MCRLDIQNGYHPAYYNFVRAIEFDKVHSWRDIVHEHLKCYKAKLVTTDRWELVFENEEDAVQFVLVWG